MKHQGYYLERVYFIFELKLRTEMYKARGVKMIKRDLYLRRIISNMWNGEIKVITGIRRCGKSVLLFELFYKYLLQKNIADENIIKIALDQRRYYKFRDPIVLCDYIEEFVEKNKNQKFYLLIDEVQFTKKVIDKKNGDVEVSIYDMLNELKAYKNLDVYVTGSNSKMLSKDIATEFRGRATQIHVQPLSFAEFYSAVGGDKRDALDQYMLYGGMPRIVDIHDVTDNFPVLFKNKSKFGYKIGVISHLVYIIVLVSARFIHIPECFAGNFFNSSVIFFCF